MVALGLAGMAMMPQTTPKVYDLNLYLKAIDAFPLLTLEQELELARRVREGDLEAREAMISSNLRLVVSIARQYVGMGNYRRSLSDLIEEGNLGLIQAVSRFRPESFKTRFSTYAAWWIKQSIRNSLRNGNWPMRIPAYMHTLLSAIRKEGITDISQLDTPEGLNILKKVKGKRGNWKKTVDQVKKAMSASTMGMVDSTENGNSTDFVLEQDYNSLEAVEFYINKERIEVLLKSIEEDLDEREQAVVKGRFGLGQDSCSSTLREVGESLGLTRERVRQIEAQAMAKLKQRCALAGEQDEENDDD